MERPEKIFDSVGKACSIVNPLAANRKWQRRKRLRDFLNRNLPGCIYDEPGNKESTIELAKTLGAKNDLIIAIGGDGTVADVIQGIREAGRERDVILGVIPFGSGNAFRKALRIPKNIKRAMAVLKRGEIREIDLIDVGGRTAGFVSIGGTAEITRFKSEHDVQGFLGHLLAARIMFKLEKKESEVELYDGVDDLGKPFAEKRLTLKLLDCVVAKTNYFGYGWRVAPLAELEDGYLDITFFEIGLSKYLLLVPLIYLGMYQKRLRHYKAKRMIIRGSGLPVQYNGESLGTMNEVELKVIPRAFRIIAPKTIPKKR